MSFEVLAQVTKTADGKIRTVNTPYMLEIGGEQTIDGHTAICVHGSNEAVGTTEEVIGEQGGVQNYVSSAEALQVSSSSTQDDAGGTGALTVELNGLDANYDVLTETVTTNGTASVETTNSFIRMFCARVLTDGGSGSNVGTISIKDNADTNTLAVIVPLHGKSQNAIWTVPADNRAVIINFWGSATSSQNVIVHLYTREPSASWNLQRQFTLKDSPFDLKLEGGIRIPEKTDIELRANVGASTAIVMGGVDGWYESNTGDT